MPDQFIPVPRPPVKQLRTWDGNGPYVPRSLDALIDLVASLSDLSAVLIRSDRQRPINVCHARAVIGILAKEQQPLLSDRAIEDALNRGAGIVDWWRKRHVDRLKTYPAYAHLYDRCKAAMDCQK